MGRLFVGLFALVTAALLPGQVTFTITATAYDSVQGYNTGTPYTFVFTTGASFGNNTNSIFTATESTWREEVTTEDQLWSSISGSGLAGSFVRPNALNTDPHSEFSIYEWGGEQYFELLVGTDDGIPSSIGLTTLSGGALSYLNFYFDAGTLPNFVYPGAYVDLPAYLATYTGTYIGFDVGGDDYVELLDSSRNLYLYFDITSVTISAVPEPASYAALAGALVLGLAALRRRRT